MIIDAILQLKRWKNLAENGNTKYGTVEELEQSIQYLKEEEKKQNQKRTYETYLKLNDKWLFVGWSHQMNEDFCIEAKRKGNYIYKTYKWLNGEVEEYRYGSYIEEE